MDETADLRQTIEALTARVVILESVVAASMEEAELPDLDPLEAYHRTALQRRKDQ